MLKGATFSDDRMYRYELWREWEPTRPAFVVIGLNPSTADENNDDPTIRRCMGFARRFDCGQLVMLNLYAFRATSPKDMLAAVDPVGPRTDEILRWHAERERTQYTVAAWGANATLERAAVVAEMFPTLHCFGVNANGSPKHPLYLPLMSVLNPYRSVSVTAGLRAKDGGE